MKDRTHFVITKQILERMEDKGVVNRTYHKRSHYSKYGSQTPRKNVVNAKSETVGASFLKQVKRYKQ